MNFSFITFISVRVGKRNKQRMWLFPISECFPNKCSWKNAPMFLKPKYFWTIPFENDSFSWLIITFRCKIYRFCKNILYCFLPIGGKYRIVEKFGISLRPDAHIRTSTALLKWHLPTLKTHYDRLIRFLLKNVLRYWYKLNQCFKQTFQWSGGIELIWIGFPNQNKRTHQKRNCFVIFQSENVSSKKKLKSLKNFNTDTKSGTQKIEAS